MAMSLKLFVACGDTAALPSRIDAKKSKAS